MKSIIPAKKIVLGKQEYLDLVNLIEELEESAKTHQIHFEELKTMTQSMFNKLEEAGMVVEKSAFDHPRVIIRMNHDQITDMAPKFFIKGIG